jgi:hypothetical protein
MRQIKIVLATLVAAVVVASRALAQDLDGTLKKDQALGDSNDRLSYVCSALFFSWPGQAPRRLFA